MDNTFPLRVFPRKTNATPEDDMVRFDIPTLFDHPTEVHVSVTFTWDIEKGKRLADAWSMVCDNVKIDGPAFGNMGGEFTPGLYLKKGYTITSRGCPNHCWFCSVPKREGYIRELEIKDGWIVTDNNLLACSRPHIEKVFAMLERQHEHPVFTGGLEAKLLEAWHLEYLVKLKPTSLFFAYDTSDDYEPLVEAAKLLRHYNMIRKGNHAIRCYVLIGWKNDKIDKANERLEKVARLGYMPFAMLYNHGEEREQDRKEWVSFARTWANPWIVGTKFRNLYSADVV